MKCNIVLTQGHEIFAFFLTDNLSYVFLQHLFTDSPDPIVGAPGTKGEPGKEGAQGVKGEKGEIGSEGKTGQTGATGAKVGNYVCSSDGNWFLDTLRRGGPRGFRFSETFQTWLGVSKLVGVVTVKQS